MRKTRGVTKILDPRKALMWKYYIHPHSETFGNCMQSAIKAGYTKGYAATINDELWFLEKKRRLGMYVKAEKVLEQTLDDYQKDAKLAQDTAKFVAKTLGKEEYSERTEVTGENGAPLAIEISEVIAKKNKLN